ncbi:MAG: ribonuclease H-like domain-containing protein [Atribacterota bacterium]
MRVAVIDIETCGFMEELEYPDYQYLKNRGREKTDEEVERGLSFNPFLAHVIALALVHVADDHIEEGVVYYLSKEEDKAWVEEKTVGGEEIEIHYHPVPCVKIPRDVADGERMILEGFNLEIQESERLVTYNGRSFDLPFLRLRSMLYNLPVRKELELSRYGRGGDFHLDLVEFLFAREGERLSLDFVARRFGIEIGKGTMDGSKVHEVFLRGGYREIARYNCNDALMTALLYLRLLPYIGEEEVNLPSERQIDYLAKLLSRLEGREKEAARQIFVWFQESGVLTRDGASRLIDYLKSLHG